MCSASVPPSPVRHKMCSAFVAPRQPLRSSLLLLLLLLPLLEASKVGVQYRQTYSSNDTQFHWVNATMSGWGVITTEGFSDPPWARHQPPRRAVWFLHAPPDHGVIVYMTQYHMTDNELASYSYHTCLDKGGGFVRCYWDKPVSDGVEASREVNNVKIRRSTELVTTRGRDRWLVLHLDPTESGEVGGPAGGCLMASQSRGFNFTYQTIRLPATSNPTVQSLARKERCYARLCNLNGDCMASSDFRRMSCHCLPGFHGDRCQYGPLCDPEQQINPCWNNGTCRQRMDIVECLCGLHYSGSRCENKLEGLQEPSDCLQYWALSCTDGCVLDGQRYRCACHPNSRPRGDGSCSALPALRHFIIRLSVTDSDLQLTDRNIESRLDFNHSLYERAEPLRVVEFDNNAVGRDGTRPLLLLLTALSSDSLTLYGRFSGAVARGRVGQVGVRPLAFSFHWVPEVAITSLSLESQPAPWADVGSQARLTCTVRGNRRTRVSWYKDGARINVTSANLLRDHPVSTGSFALDLEQFSHFLTVGRLVAEDEGRFQCRAQDERGGPVAWRAVRVGLASLQLALRVTPALVSVRPGRNVTLTCTMLSDQITRNQSTLTWNKSVNGGAFRPLTSHDHEQVVRFCWGRSLLIIRQPETARYECFASRASMSNQATAQVMVMSPGQLTCPRVRDGEVTWQETAAGRDDLQLCPGGQEEIVVPGRVIKLPARYARRPCELLSKTRASWGAADLSACVDRQLFTLQKQVDQLMAGYSVSPLEAVMADMRQAMQQRLEAAQERRPAVLLAAEVEGFRRLLVGVSSYLLELVPDEQLVGLEADFVGTLTPLLGAAGGGQLSDQHKADLLAAKLRFLLRLVFVKPSLESQPDADTFVTARLFPYTGGSAHEIMPHRTLRRPGWLGAEAEVSLSADQPWRYYDLAESQLGLVMVVFRDTRDLYPNGYTPDHSAAGLGRSRDQFVLDSRVVSIGLDKQPRHWENHFPPAAQVTLALEPLSRRRDPLTQHHSCARLTPSGRWRLDACAISSGEHSAHCTCDGLGTFALALVTRAPSSNDSKLPEQIEEVWRSPGYSSPLPMERREELGGEKKRLEPWRSHWNRHYTAADRASQLKTTFLRGRGGRHSG